MCTGTKEGEDREDKEDREVKFVLLKNQLVLWWLKSKASHRAV